jgi:hypothetical protein
LIYGAIVRQGFVADDFGWVKDAHSRAGQLRGVPLNVSCLLRCEAVTKYDGSPVLKVGGCFMAGLATHCSAEPETLVVRITFDERERLLEDAPDTYYLTELPHRAGSPGARRPGHPARPVIRVLAIDCGESAKRPRTPGDQVRT